MQLRFGRTTLATLPRIGDGGGDGDNMNASLWGELQCFIDLSFIYAKLPLAPFFRLRQVCKEWNRLASDRQFLEHNFKPPISNLYFVVHQERGHRLWTCQDSSWTSSPLPRRRCEVSGLLYEGSDHHRVFDLHTRVFYSLPPLPSGKLVDDGALVGMTVDTTLIPYGFRVFTTEPNGTNIYDSSSGIWTTLTSSYRPSWRMAWGAPFTLSSIHYKRFLYMWVETFIGGCFVQKFDLEEHVWVHELIGDQRFLREWKCGGIGVWRHCWFAFGMKSKWVLTAWQMDTDIQELWTMFDSMPKDLCEWMMSGFGYQNILSTFCGEHVLVYNRFEVEERAILYNLDHKTWNKLAPQKICGF